MRLEWAVWFCQPVAYRLLSNSSPETKLLIILKKTIQDFPHHHSVGFQASKSLPLDCQFCSLGEQEF